MSKIFKDVRSTAKSVLPFVRDDNHAYIRTNIVKVTEPATEFKPEREFWQYDEEVLTHSEYMDRLENLLASQEETNMNTMLGLAELYETLCDKGVI